MTALCEFQPTAEGFKCCACGKVQRIETYRNCPAVEMRRGKPVVSKGHKR